MKLFVRIRTRQVWVSSCNMAKRQGLLSKKTRMAYFLSACWIIWKERNEGVFGGTTMQPRAVAQRALHEGRCGFGTVRGFQVGMRGVT